MADLSPIPPLIPPEAAASAIDGSGVGAAEELAPEETTNSESQPPVNPQAAAGPGAEEQLRRIVGAIEEQSASLKTAFENLTKTIDAGRPQIQSTDKKIAFWTAYKGLAYEFDREFQAKHGGDLDTALIFAGLFSAVASAFIIQIQPEFQPDPNAGTQALLALLVHNVTGIAIPLAAPAGAPSAVIVAQSFLYASLFSTLLAALLAVLGKQWLLYYDSAGEKGTIEQRGIERQKKFSGIQRWKFGIVMQLCPLLIQFSLLLFAVALSLYLWTIHHTLAGIALASTALGSILYTIMIILAGVFPDSPFQTPLAGLLQNLIQGISFHGPIYKLWARQWETFSTTLDHVHTSFSETVSGVNNLIPLLPIFANSDPEPGTPDPEPMFPPPPPPSPQTLAIVWTLETSTDPTVVEAAAALVSEFQWWSLPFDVEPAMTRLKDVFFSLCTDNFNKIPDQHSDRATSCLRALGMFALTTHNPALEDILFQYSDVEPLKSMLICTRMATRRDSEYFRGTHIFLTSWCLQLFAAYRMPFTGINLLRGSLRDITVSVQNPADFAEFLFCLNSFFTPAQARDCSVPDKSQHMMLLITCLFEHLFTLFANGSPLDQALVTDLLLHAAQLLEGITVLQHYEMDNRCINAVYCLSATPNLPSGAKLSIMRLLRNLYAGKSVWVENTNMDATWIHGLVEEVNPLQDGYQDVISDLIHFLWYFRPKYGQATLVSLQHILGVITSFDNTQRARHLAVMILCSSKNWFLSPITGPMLEAQSHQIWSVLISYRYCITLGAKLSHLPQWKLVISEDLPGCLDLYDQSQLFGSDLQSFKLLLFHVWEVDDGAFGGFGDEEVNAIRFTLLVKEWNQINVFTVRRQANLKLLRCTVRVMFSIRLEQFNLHQPSQSFKDTIMPPLGAALRAAGARLNAAVEFEGSTDQKQMDALNFMADILLKLGSFTEGELRNGTNLTKREREHWIGLKDSFLVDIKKLGEMWGEGPEED